MNIIIDSFAGFEGGWAWAWVLKDSRAFLGDFVSPNALGFGNV